MNFQKFFLMLFVSFSLIGTVFADTEYDFVIEIDHDFDEDEEINCDLKYDSKKKEREFDENDKGSELELDYSFDDELSFKCDEKVDEIKLEILDKEGNEVFQETYKNTREIEYVLELYEIKIELEHDFDGDNNPIICDLTYDETEEEFNFSIDENGDELNFEIEVEFLEEVEFDCDDKLDEIKYEVDDSDNDQVYSYLEENEDKFVYETSYLPQNFQVSIFIEHDFDSESDCELDVDQDNVRDYEFDEDTKQSKKRIEEVSFAKDIKFSCDEKLDFFTVVIDDIKNDEDDYFVKEYENTKSFSLDIDNLPKQTIEKEEEIEEDVKEEEPKEAVEELVEKEPEIEFKEVDLEDDKTSQIEIETQENTTLNQTQINESQNLNQVEPVKDSELNFFIGVVSVFLVIIIVLVVIKL